MFSFPSLLLFPILVLLHWAYLPAVLDKSGALGDFFAFFPEPRRAVSPSSLKIMLVLSFLCVPYQAEEVCLYSYFYLFLNLFLIIADLQYFINFRYTE